MTRTSLDALGEILAHALIPLGEVAGNPEMIERALAALGFAPPEGVDLAKILTLDATGVARKLQIIVEAPSQERDDTLLMGQRYAALLVEVVKLLDEIRAFAEGLPVALAAAGPYVEKSKIDKELPRRLLDFLLVAAIAELAPPVAFVLRLLGVIHFESFQEDMTIYQVAHRRTIIRPEIFGTLFSDPGKIFVDEYGWGTASFDAEALLTNLGLFVQSLGLRPTMRSMPQAVEEALGGRAMPDAVTDPSPQLLVPITTRGRAIPPADVSISMHRLRATTVGGIDAGLELAVLVSGTAGVAIPIHPELALQIDASLDLGAGIGVAIRPGSAELQTGFLDGGTPRAGAAGRFGIGLHRKRADAKPTELIFAPGGTRIEANDVFIEVGATLAIGKEPDPYVQVGIVGGRIVITLSGADGFLGKVMPLDGIESRFDLKIGWSRHAGLRFEGSGMLEIAIPAHKTYGPFNLDVITLRLGTIAHGLSLMATVTGGVRLGLAYATIQDVGFRADLGFKPGNLGPANFAIGFKPPTGVGLSIDAGPVTGGGYLFFDRSNGQYAGVAQLEFKGIALKAIGLITTRMPDGSNGFSLLIIISAEFTPIQLGYGFTLNGVGGLLGVNRTAVVDVLREGIRDRSLDAVLFPRDPVAEAPRIISTLSRAFPPAARRYVFGPMARLGWGTPTLLTLDLGLLLELPSPVQLVVLGRLRMALPDERIAIVRINMDVLGVVDFDKSEASLDATLYDSVLAGFAISGDMALRARWDSNPTFALSAGGFHPGFQPPHGFPALRRMSMALATGGNPQLRLEAYLALTANTVQFGARLDVRVEGLGFTVEGMLAFDTLMELNPFGFIANMTGLAALRRGGPPLMSVELSVTLSGPRPWHARGLARFHFIVKSEIPFDIQLGHGAPPAPPEPVKVRGMLTAALDDARNWTAQLPGAGEALVTLRSIPKEPGKLLAHPLGTLGFTQRVAPLGLWMTRYGTAPITNGNRFKVVAIRLNPDSPDRREFTDLAAVREHFAPAQFLDMSHDEKLSGPSFVDLEAGRRLKPTGLTFEEPTLEVVPMEYETIPIDEAEALFFEPVSGEELVQLAPAGAAGVAATRTGGQRRYEAEVASVKVQETRYIVADPTAEATSELMAGLARATAAGISALSSTVALSYAEAAERLRELRASDPVNAARLRVLVATPVGAL
jgi:hypothetical protein